MQTYANTMACINQYILLNYLLISTCYNYLDALLVLCICHVVCKQDVWDQDKFYWTIDLKYFLSTRHVWITLFVLKWFVEFIENVIVKSYGGNIIHNQQNPDEHVHNKNHTMCTASSIIFINGNLILNIKLCGIHLKAILFMLFWNINIIEI